MLFVAIGNVVDPCVGIVETTSTGTDVGATELERFGAFAGIVLLISEGVKVGSVVIFGVGDGDGLFVNGSVGVFVDMLIILS